MCKSVLRIVGMNSTISHKRMASFCVSKCTTPFDNRNRFEINLKRYLIRRASVKTFSATFTGRLWKIQFYKNTNTIRPCAWVAMTRQRETK